MKTNLEFGKLIALIFIAVIPMQTIAQESAARISQIATISEQRKRESINETSLAQLKRSTQDNWLNAKKNDDLYFNDILKLNKNIWVRVDIKNNIQGGKISLLQEDLSESGRYKFIEDKDGSGRVSLELIEGYAIFNVFKDAISTITRGLQSAVKSGSTTCALYNVRSDGSGEIYLQQGHLLFPGNSKIPGLNTGQVAQFENGQITKVFFPDVLMASKYNDFIKFNNSTVWKKPLLKQPVTWIGVALVGIGTALIITKPWESKEVTGTININWGGN